MLDWLILVGVIVLMSGCVWLSLRVVDQAIARMQIGDLTADDEDLQRAADTYTR